jgi:hypothetical protein
MRLTLGENHTSTAQQNVFITGDVKTQALSIPDSESYRRANEIIETVLHGLNESSDLRLVTWLRHPVSEGFIYIYWRYNTLWGCILQPSSGL